MELKERFETISSSNTKTNCSLLMTLESKLDLEQAKLVLKIADWKKF